MKKITLKSISLAGVSGVLLLASAIGLLAPRSALADDCIRALPSITATSDTIQTGAPGDTLTYTFSLTNNDSVGCYGSEFMTAPNVPFDWSPTLSPQGTIVLAPQQSADFTFTVASATWVTDAAYDVAVDFLQHYLDPVITDDYFSFTYHFTYKVVGATQVDTMKPGVQIISPTSGTMIKRNDTIIITAHAVDNVGVTDMTYSVNGVTLCTGTVTPFCSWQPTKRGTYTITVTARDSAGNIGSNSVTVSVK